MSSQTPRNLRMAVAENRLDGSLAPRLGKALRFAIFDFRDQRVRGPLYRVRHDEPGSTCGHTELAALLHDCQVVIAGGAGERMVERMRNGGAEVVIAPGDKPSVQLAADWFAGRLRSHRP